MKELLAAISKLLKLPNISTPHVPPPLILIGGGKRAGLSAKKIAERVIRRKVEAGLPIGNLANGEQNPDEVMIRIMVEEIIKAIQQEAKTTVVIPQGTVIQGTGGNAGGPVQVVGTTVTMTTGYAVIQ